MIRRRPIRKSAYRWSPSPKPANVLRFELIEGGAVRRYPDGREVCTETAQGRREYARRVELMLERQSYRCCLCGERLALAEATFEHQRRRGMGAAFRDDRDDRNGSAHWSCNVKKG
jgi:hypothetical protein